jgi:hypothetical protein
MREFTFIFIAVMRKLIAGSSLQILQDFPRLLGRQVGAHPHVGY